MHRSINGISQYTSRPSHLYEGEAEDYTGMVVRLEVKRRWQWRGWRGETTMARMLFITLQSWCSISRHHIVKIQRLNKMRLKTSWINSFDSNVHQPYDGAVLQLLWWLNPDKQLPLVRCRSTNMAAPVIDRCTCNRTHFTPRRMAVGGQRKLPTNLPGTEPCRSFKHWTTGSLNATEESKTVIVKITNTTKSEDEVRIMRITWIFQWYPLSTNI